METKSGSNASGNICTGKLCLAAVAALPIGIGLFFLTLVFNRFLGDFFALGIWASIGLVGLVVPCIGLVAVVVMLWNWRDTTNPRNGRANEGHIRKTAHRFLVCSLVFAAACLLPPVLVALMSSGQSVNVPGLAGLWLLAMALLALSMGVLSYKLFAGIFSQFRRRSGAILSILISFVAVIVMFFSLGLDNYLIQRLEYSKVTQTFSGNSDSLQNTTIVATLDSPRPENKNVIWCSSFQLAWNRIRDDVIGEPVEVIGAEKLAARLNKAQQSAADLEANSFYAAAGRMKQGIIDDIRKGMSAKFPSYSVPDFNDIAGIPDAILAYSYLTANVPFKHPFRQVKVEFTFTDSQGVETNVGAFGAWGISSQYKKRMREQVEILYLHEDREATDRDLQIKEFAVDLCKHSEPYQVVAAVVEPKDSLDQTLDYVRGKVADSRQKERYEQMSLLDYVDVLTVPEMFWDIDHRFDELIGKTVANANPAMPIIEARQAIKFKLDRYGAMLESESILGVTSTPRCFKFNRPFLVYMKKRDCEQPFFVMWVDNAELLNRE